MVLKRPQLWKDPYEGFPFRFLESEQGLLIVNDYFRQNDIFFYDDILSVLKDTIYCLCFTKTPESEAMWKSYNYNTQSLRLSFDFNEIYNIQVNNNYFNLVNVKYSDKEMLKYDLRKYLKTIIYKKNNNIILKPYNGFIIKRREFIHENECRLLFYNTNSLLGKNDITKTKIFYLGETKIDHSIITDTYKLNMIDNEISIKSVLLHPDYNDFDTNNISQLCSENNIEFLGKSKLYTFE